VIKRVSTFVENYKVILENFSFLSILQVSNLVIFFLLIPYLFRVLGKENYGIVIFAQTIAAYFTILINFGLNATATHDISVNRDDPVKRTAIISSVLVIKILFFSISLLTVLFLVIIIPVFRNHPAVFIFSMLYCLSEALFPVWFFQGIEKMKYITYINVGTRIISALAVFIIIKEPADYYLIPLLLGLGTFTGSIIGLSYMFSIKGNQLQWQSLKKLKASLDHNLPLFLSYVSSNAYVNGNRLVIGSFLGMQVLALYDIAERLVNMVKVPLIVIGQVLFPKVSRDSDTRFITKTLIFTTLAYVLIYVVLFVFANHIIKLFTGSFNIVTASLVRVLGFSIIPISAGLFYADLLLIPFGFLKDYARVRVGSLIFYLIILSILFIFNFIGVMQLAVSVIVVEFFVLLYSYYLSRKNSLI
jgi:O-antigen/teichoic acid export membrane protein